MGINDKDYADALEHQRAHQIALMKLELEKQKEEAKMAGLLSTVGGVGAYQRENITSTNTGITLNTNALTNAVWSNTQMGIKTLNEQDLQHDAMKAPLSALIDMWTMRWQGEWVSETEFQEDDFWRLALIRLVGANKLEKHHLANQYAAVYRIIE